MPALLELVAKLFALLKPLVAPSEYDKWAKEFWRIKEANDERKKRIKEALAAGDVPALNVILSELLDL